VNQLNSERNAAATHIEIGSTLMDALARKFAGIHDIKEKVA
jgi:hypothetical protein